MKWSYIIAFAAGILFFTLLTWSPWWLVGGAAVFLTVWIWRLFSERRYIREVKHLALEQQLHDLHTRLERSGNREQQLTRIAEQATAAKRQLMATMKQEIRTPVNGMIGMASLLTETPLSDQQREYINGILNCGEQLVAVVNHILVDDLLNSSVSGDEGGRLTEDRLDLRVCVREVLDMFAGRVGEAGPVLSSQIDDEIPEQLAGDCSRIKQILINLLDNAVRNTSHGEIKVVARQLKKREDGKVELGFEVRDTGTGIPASRIGRIFDGVSQTNPVTGYKKEDTGLGLVVCRRLVEMMGGSIEVQSEPGKGCIFTFRICLGTAVVQAPRQPMATGADARGDKVSSLALKD